MRANKIVAAFAAYQELSSDERAAFQAMLKATIDTTRAVPATTKRVRIVGTRRRWTPDEDAEVKLLISKGWSIKRIARKLRRTPQALWTRISDRNLRGGR